MTDRQWTDADVELIHEHLGPDDSGQVILRYRELDPGPDGDVPTEVPVWGDGHEQAAAVLDALTADGWRKADAPCNMTHTPPFDFAQCETHDETFPLGQKCRFDGREMWEVFAEEADEQRQRAVRAEMDVGRLDARVAELEQTLTQRGCQVLAELAAERARQDAKWGEQNHPDGTGGSAAIAIADDARAACQRAAAEGRTTWSAILLEEVWEALAEEDTTAIRAELVQVAAVVVAWVEAIDRRTSAPPETAPCQCRAFPMHPTSACPNHQPAPPETAGGE